MSGIRQKRISDKRYEGPYSCFSDSSLSRSASTAARSFFMALQNGLMLKYARSTEVTVCEDYWDVIHVQAQESVSSLLILHCYFGASAIKHGCRVYNTDSCNNLESSATLYCTGKWNLDSPHT